MSTTLPTNTRPRPAPHALAAAHGERTVLLDVRRGRYFSMDGVGGRIWELIQQGCDWGSVLDRLEAEYDAPRDVLEHDATRFLAALKDARLVTLE